MSIKYHGNLIQKRPWTPNLPANRLTAHLSNNTKAYHSTFIDCDITIAEGSTTIAKMCIFENCIFYTSEALVLYHTEECLFENCTYKRFADSYIGTLR